jgi:hypothetical protein
MERGFRIVAADSQTAAKIHCHSLEIVRLTADLFLAHAAESQSVLVRGVMSRGQAMLSCESALAAVDDQPDLWQSMEDMTGVTGIPVLLDEIARLSEGKCEFRWRDSTLQGMRLWMRSA